MKNLIVKDINGKILVKVNKDGKMAIARYPSMNLNTIDYVVDICADLGNENLNGVKDFLLYNNDEYEFCS